MPAYGPIPSAPTSPYAPADASAAPYPVQPRQGGLAPEGTRLEGRAGRTSRPATSRDRRRRLRRRDPRRHADGVHLGEPAGVGLAPPARSSPRRSPPRPSRPPGSTITLQTKTFNFLISNYNDQNPEAAKYTNEWGVNNYGGLFIDYYPTQRGLEHRRRLEPRRLQRPDGEQADGSLRAQRQPRRRSRKRPPTSRRTSPVFFMPDGDYLLAVNTRRSAEPAEAGRR